MKITLKYQTQCRWCNAPLSRGEEADWRKRGGVVCLACIRQKTGRKRPWREDEPLGLTMSRYDRFGVYTPDGQRIGSTCGCEDYPCCGH